MVPLPDDRAVVRDHPDYPGEAVVLDSAGNPLFYAPATLSDADIIGELDAHDALNGVAYADTSDREREAGNDSVNARVYQLPG